MAASLFSGIGSFYAIGLVVYAFVGPNSITTNVGFRSFAYFYILMGLSIVALLPLMFFTCKITFQHFKSRSFASDASDPVTFSAKATEDVTVNIS